MKEIPRIAGWPTQTAFVLAPQKARKKRRLKKYHSKG
jgi:hypothetical protein